MTTLNRKYIRPTIWKPRKSQRELHAYFTNLSVNDIYCQPNYKLAEHLGVSIQTASERVRNHAAIGACKILREVDSKGRIVFNSAGRKPVTRIQLFPEDKWHEPTRKGPQRNPCMAPTTMKESHQGSPTIAESLHGVSSRKDNDLSVPSDVAMQESHHHNTSISSVKESVYIGSVDSAVCSVMEESLHGSVRNRRCLGRPTDKPCKNEPMTGRNLCRACAYGDDVGGAR